MSKKTQSERCAIEPAFSHGEWQHWHDISWPKLHQTVRGLQVRIAKAAKAGNWRRVKTLQRLLTRSFAARALAVRRVTENRGRRTPGIDGETWSTTDEVGETGVFRTHEAPGDPEHQQAGDEVTEPEVDSFELVSAGVGHHEADHQGPVEDPHQWIPDLDLFPVVFPLHCPLPQSSVSVVMKDSGSG
jgi:hypothetical protein